MVLASGGTASGSETDVLKRARNEPKNLRTCSFSKFSINETNIQIFNPVEYFKFPTRGNVCIRF